MEDKMLYKDPSQSVEDRVEDLLSRMTLEEKAAQLCGDLAASFIVDGTLFPAQINVGATWEPELAQQMSSVIGQESRAVGITSAMSPVIDVSRDPRWGRTYETYGEDTYLVSQMGIHYPKR
jgi:beta-glucosidase